MKALDYEAVLKQINKILEDGFKKLKVKPQHFWNRVKWKILGVGSLICALHHDNEVLKCMDDELCKLNKDVKQGYYHIEVTMDEAGIHPLPCPLCHGEKRVLLRTEVVEYPLTGFFTPFIGVILHDVYGTCPICNGSGYKPALTKLQEKLLKESRPIREIDRS